MSICLQLRRALYTNHLLAHLEPDVTTLMSYDGVSYVRTLMQWLPNCFLAL